MESNLTKINQLNCKTDRIRYNLDHLYCHTNESNYISASSNSELIGILKENKQLKSMILLHLDLIQEQSDQLLSKEKDITNLKEENSILRQKLEIINQNIQTQEEQNKELSDQFDSDNDSTSEEKLEVNSKQNLREESIVNRSENIFKINSNQFEETHSGKNDSIIGERNGQFINKIILQRVIPSEKQDIKIVNVEESNNTPTTKELTITAHQKVTTPAVNKEDVYTFSDIFDGNSSEDIQNIKKSYKYLSDDHHNHSHNQSMENYVDNKTMNKRRKTERKVSESEIVKKQYIKGATMTTEKNYLSRVWISEEIDNELIKQANDIALETPSWTVKECSGCYSIEGTEDLNDEIFLKRHSKLETEEKRRKKWDVQRIREQRTIERLKRRHCKTEMLEDDTKKKVININSFYPSINTLKYIEITENIPVQAFGENIPLLQPNEFTLPWQTSTTIKNTNKTFSINSKIELSKLRNNSRQKFSDLPFNRLQRINSLKS